MFLDNLRYLGDVAGGAADAAGQAAQGVANAAGTLDWFTLWAI